MYAYCYHPYRLWSRHPVPLPRVQDLPGLYGLLKAAHGGNLMDALMLEDEEAAPPPRSFLEHAWAVAAEEPQELLRVCSCSCDRLPHQRGQGAPRVEAPAGACSEKAAWAPQLIQICCEVSGALYQLGEVEEDDDGSDGGDEEGTDDENDGNITQQRR